MISVYTLSDLGDLSNLIVSLSRTIQQYSPPSEWIMWELGVFPIFLENDLLKVDKILGLTFFKARKDSEGFNTTFFSLLQLSFVLNGLFTTPMYSRRRSRFVNSAFSNKKIWLKSRSLFMTNKFKRKCLQKFYASSKQEKEWYRKTTSYLEQPSRPFLSALHAKNDTTNPFGYKLGESTENNKRLLFFAGKETIQSFNGSIKAIALLFTKW